MDVERTGARAGAGDVGSDAPTDPRELDYLYKEADRVYYSFARRCGLSTCAYWMMYDIERAGGSLALLELSDTWSYSKQTINSAIKVLREKGLIELDFIEGSRKNKEARLTDAGRDFAARYIAPVQEAERRAFCSLDPAARATFLETARAYTRALADEFARSERMLGELPADTEQ